MATMADVARHAGVSVKTVSNVLSGYPYIRETTRERVLASVDALGYEINVTAQILRSGRSGVIGLAVPELGQPYFGELADEILAAARRHGLHVLIEPTGFTREGELTALREPRRGLIDGLIFSPAALDQADAHLLDSLGYPLVLLGEQIFSPSVDHVTMRNIDGARAATDLLLDVGRRRIAVIGMLHARDGRVGVAAVCGLQPGARGARDRGRHRGCSAGRTTAGTAATARVRWPTSSTPACRWTGWSRSTTRWPSVRCTSSSRAGSRSRGDVAVVGFDDIEDARYSCRR